MSAFVPLLGAKLLPPDPGQFHLVRPRLHDRLRAGMSRRCTVVLAGPGYGKTSLTARFLREWEGDSVWLSVDASDRDPWLLFRYLSRGLREHAPELGSRTEDVWQDLRSRPEEVDRLCDLFISDAEESLGARFVLVLDGVHHLEASLAGTRALRRLLAYLPGTLHLILIGRALPDIGVRTLAAEGAVDILSGEDLLFTREETQALLLDTFALPISKETAEKIHARTRGWPTALQLLRQSARLTQPSPDLPEQVFVRTESEIFDYFSEEVLAAEPDSTREFLLATSIPPVIHPDLLSDVLPHLDVRAILASLLKRKLFVTPLESGGELYAYDPLFRDFLRRKLRAERGAEALRDLHVRYGEAFRRHGEWAQALAHFRDADDARRTAEVLRRHGEPLLRTGQLDAVKQAARFLETRGIRSATAEALLGEALRRTGDYAAAVGHFEKALAGLEKGGARPGVRPSARQGLAYSLLKTGHRERAAVVAEEALTEAGREDPALRALILNTLSIIRTREERHTEAVAGWQEALTLAREAGDDRLIRMIAHNLGLPHAVFGDFARASECFRILTSSADGSLGPEHGAACLNLARIETLRGEHASAAKLLEDAREIASRLHLTALSADVLEAEGTLRREGGDLEGARECYALARSRFTELGQREILDNLAEEEAILAARRGEFAEAEALALELVESRRKASEREGLASSLLTLGEIRVRAGRPAKALEPLHESARAFRELRRSYQECLAYLYLALATHRTGKPERARGAARRALLLSAGHDYAAAVRRIAALDAGFGNWLAGLPSAPAGLQASGKLPSVLPAPAVRSETSDLTIRLFGPIEVYRDADNKIPPRAWKLRRALEVFCYLAAARERRATKEKIVDALWGDARLSAIEKNFHPTISFLRGALNHGRQVPKNFILFERGSYLLNPAHRYDIDAERFETGVRAARARAREGDPSAALSAYDQALVLYRGPFLEEEYGGWVEAPRAHFETLYLDALAEAGRLHMKAGDARASLSYQRRRLELDPLSEEASIDLMHALGCTGDRAALEKEFERLTGLLADELGAEPAPETRRAYETARAMKAAPSPAAAPARTQPAAKSRTASRHTRR